MEDKILDSVNYIKNISKEKVKSEIIFVYMKKVMNLLVKKKLKKKKKKKTIATLISLNRLEERGICTKS